MSSFRVWSGIIAPCVLVLAMSLLGTGCGGGGKDGGGSKDAAESKGGVESELAKLSPEDRKLAEAQKFCVVQTKSRLGSMGAPIKLTINGQPVFICCDHCKTKAEADPDKTLKTLSELKAK